MSMEYTTEPMDSLPSIAEAFGMSGHWQVLAELNADRLMDPHNVQPGQPLLIPAEWVTDIPPTTTSDTGTATTTSDESESSSSHSSRTHSGSRSSSSDDK